MGVKKVLGLESFPIADREIMRRIAEARRNDLNEVVFTSPGCKTVKLKLSRVNTAGLMREYDDYYAK